MSRTGRIRITLSAMALFGLSGLLLADDVSIPIAPATEALPTNGDTACDRVCNNGCESGCNTGCDSGCHEGCHEGGCGLDGCDDCGCHQHRLSCPCTDPPALSCPCKDLPKLTCHQCGCDDRHLSRVERTARAWAQSNAMLGPRHARVAMEWEKSDAILIERHQRAGRDWEISDSLYYGTPCPTVESTPAEIMDEMPLAPLATPDETYQPPPPRSIESLEHPTPPPRFSEPLDGSIPSFTLPPFSEE